MNSTSNIAPLKKTVTDSILFSKWEKVTLTSLGENSQKSKSEDYARLATREERSHPGNRDGGLRGPMSRVQGLPRFISGTAVQALLSIAIHQEIKRQFAFEVLGFFLHLRQQLEVGKGDTRISQTRTHPPRSIVMAQMADRSPRSDLLTPRDGRTLCS